MPGFMCLPYKSFENSVGKKEIARISTHLESFLPFLSNLKLLSANAFNLDQSKNVSFVKELN